MNRAALLAFFLAGGLGAALVHFGEATLLARLTATVCVLCVVLLALLLLTALLRHLPRPVLLTLGFIAALIGLRALYLALRFHWLTGGVAFLGLLLAIMLLWNARLRWPTLSRRTGVALAACCGLGLVVQAGTFPPRELLPTVRRWKREPRTRTPLSLLSHAGLLGGLVLLGAGGLLSLRPAQLEHR